MEDHGKSLQMIAGFAARTLDRRHFLHFAAGSTALIAASSLLVACGDDDDDSDADSGASGAATTPSPATSTDQPTNTTAAESDATEPAAEDEATTTPAESGDACAPGGTLIHALSADVANLDPHVRTGGASDLVKRTMFNSLTAIGVDGSLQPELAESWEISDDGLTYTFSLPKGVTWHSGDPLTANDVKVSLERILTLETSTYKSQVASIESVDVEDDLTAIVNLSEPSAPLLTSLGATSAAIMSATFLDGGGNPDETVVGTGPFIMESFEPGEKFVVVKSPNYFVPDLPYLDRIDFIPFPDENTRMAAMMSGDVDSSELIPWKDFAAVRSDPNLTLYENNGGAFMCVQYNLREAPFDDPKVRTALGFAYDRQSIIDIVFYGEGSQMTGGMISPDRWGFAPDLEGTFSYDPEKTKTLLAEAGYPDGFNCTLMATSQYGMHQGTAEIVQQNLQAVGIDCQLDLIDWTTSLQRHGASEYQFRIHGLGAGGADPDGLSTHFHSSSSHAKSTGFNDPEVDQLLEEARQITDQAERKPLYDRVQARVLELSPYSFLNNRVDGWASASMVRGFALPPAGEAGTTLKVTKVDCD